MDTRFLICNHLLRVLIIDYLTHLYSRIAALCHLSASGRTHMTHCAMTFSFVRSFLIFGRAMKLALEVDRDWRTEKTWEALPWRRKIKFKITFCKCNNAFIIIIVTIIIVPLTFAVRFLFHPLRSLISYKNYETNLFLLGPSASKSICLSLSLK